ncbi:MAG: stage 0 sporulation family protein [Anaerovoracaceae bacterium]
MIKVVGVKFKSAGKVYYFDPDTLSIEHGNNVIVETARGLEFGTVTLGETLVKEEEIIQPLKKIIRLATAADIKTNEENLKKKKEAMKLCQTKIDKHKLDMKLIDVEYTFDNNKVVFYFTADGRVDFRELVKDLASVFKMRIELRQIGVRDEAKMLGGIGNCGRGLCCSQWLSDFQPVSIKMAKTQGLSLNPTKISGICGRLMCCLKYENDIYNEMKKGMPENGEKVKTDQGMAMVVETNILENKIKVRLIIEGEKDKYDRQKLSGEIFEYTKEEIKRVSKGNKNHSKKEDDIPDEIKALLKD